MQDLPRGYYVVYKRTTPIFYCSQEVLSKIPKPIENNRKWVWWVYKDSKVYKADTDSKVYKRFERRFFSLFVRGRAYARNVRLSVLSILAVHRPFSNLKWFSQQNGQFQIAISLTNIYGFRRYNHRNVSKTEKYKL